MKTAQKPWIECGYYTFAYQGPLGLKVERLADEVGKNKSSFYHLFAELEVFQGHLLRYHLEQASIMGQKEARSRSQADLIDVMLEHKVDLLFNRQLRIHRENPDFQACFQKTNELTFPAFSRLWAEILGLGDNTHLAGLVLRLSIENFFLQVTDETLNREWLEGYFEQLLSMVRAFQNGTIKLPIER